LKKVCSFISNGWKSYALDLDEDFANQQVADENKKVAAPKKPTQPTPDAAKYEGDPNPAAFAAKPKKLSDAQNKMIYALFAKLEEDETKREERIKKALNAYKIESTKDLSMNQAKQLIDKLLEMTGQNK